MASRIPHLCVLAAGLALVATAVDLNLLWLVAANRQIEPWKVPLRAAGGLPAGADASDPRRIGPLVLDFPQIKGTPARPKESPDEKYDDRDHDSSGAGPLAFASCAGTPGKMAGGRQGFQVDLSHSGPKSHGLTRRDHRLRRGRA